MTRLAYPRGIFTSLRGTLCLALILSVSALLFGCASRGKTRTQLVHGDYEGARKTIHKQYSGHYDGVLTHLLLGRVAFLSMDYDEALLEFETARRLNEGYETTSITENIVSGTLNETARQYVMPPHELMTLYYYKALAYLAKGDVSGARVEVRQAEARLRKNLNESTIMDVPLIHYVAGLVYEKLGQRDDALISYRDAFVTDDYLGRERSAVFGEAYMLAAARAGRLREIPKLPPAVQKWVKSHLNDTTIVLFEDVGFVVQRESINITVSSPVERGGFISIPIPHYPESNVARGTPVPPHLFQEGGGEWPRSSHEVVSDMDVRARKALKRALPGIITRIVTRNVSKSLISRGASAAADNEVVGSLVSLGMSLADHADTRSFDLMPESVRVYAYHVPKGRYTLHTPSRTETIKATKARDIIVRYESVY